MKQRQKIIHKLFLAPYVNNYFGQSKQCIHKTHRNPHAKQVNALTFKRQPCPSTKLMRSGLPSVGPLAVFWWSSAYQPSVQCGLLPLLSLPMRQRAGHHDFSAG